MPIGLHLKFVTAIRNEGISKNWEQINYLKLSVGNDIEIVTLNKP